MKPINVIYALLAIFFLTGFYLPKTNHLEKNNADICVSKDEMKLYQLICDYREKNGLPKIPLSKSLCHVAQTHAKDVSIHNPNSGSCNMHSWSDNGDWTPCCYTSDHRRASCMWDKPRELTDYTGNGYEISHWSSAGITPEGAIQGWKNSKSHNAVILNKGIWTTQWKAIGIGMFENYAMVWFGKKEDQAGIPDICK